MLETGTSLSFLDRGMSHLAQSIFLIIMLTIYHHGVVVLEQFHQLILQNGKLLPFTDLNSDEFVLKSHNILMNEHYEYLLQMYGGMFEFLSESSS